MKLESIIKRYNNLMEDLGREHRTIGTEHSEETAGWGLPEMVQEAEYWLSWYYEPDVNRDDFPLNEAYRLKRFINRFKPMVEVVQEEAYAEVIQQEPTTVQAEEQPVSKEAIDEYNPLMFETCQWHMTIGTDYSEVPESWGLSKMVGQVEFVLEQCSKGNASDGVNLQEVIPAMEHFIEKYKPRVVGA